MTQTLANLGELAPTVYFNVPKGFEELAAARGRDSVLHNGFFSRVQCLIYASAGLSQTVWNRLDSDTNKTAGTRRDWRRPPFRPSPPEPPTLPRARLQSARLSSC
jgi:feruloyl-CoA synthase